MPDLSFECPHCQQSLEAPEDMAGQVIECPGCNEPICLPSVPGEAATVPPPAEACPGCGADLPDDAVLCIQCGYHRRLGRKIDTNLR